MEQEIILKAEDGSDVVFELIATLKVENTDYAIMHSVERDEDFIFKVKDKSENKEFILITEEDELKIVSDAYYEL